MSSANPLKVLDGIELNGRVNVEHETLVGNVRQAIRRGLPQVWPQPTNRERVALVGGGPSLEATLPELREAVFEGAKLVALNGAYGWCVEHNLKPSALVIIDARPGNARFVDPPVPGCRYYLASQCAPEVFDAVEGREWVAVWHAFNGEAGVKALLDEYYLGHWTGIAGGTTAGLRALNLLRTLGYMRFDLFGIDSCYLDGKGHAYPQPENDREHVVRATIAPSLDPSAAREFCVAPWHLKQLEDWLQFIRLNAQHFLLRVHGPGLLAYALEAGAEVDMTLDTPPPSPLPS